MNQQSRSRIFWMLCGVFLSFLGGFGLILLVSVVRPDLLDGKRPTSTAAVAAPVPIPAVPAADPAPALPSISPPKFDVTLDTLNYGRFLEIVLTDEQPAAVQRVVLNGRAGEKGCDFVRGNIVKECLDAIEPFRDILRDNCYGNHGLDSVTPHGRPCALELFSGDHLHPGLLRPPDDEERAKADEEIMAEAKETRGRSRESCINSGFGEGLPFLVQPSWPQRLKTGDSITVEGGSCGHQIVSAKIITDRGETEYQFDAH